MQENDRPKEFSSPPCYAHELELGDNGYKAVEQTGTEIYQNMFELIRKQRIKSLNIEAREYVHTGTGARHFHLAADDNNNVFTVAFLTVPQDSTGVAHILEHTTLCGSEKFPVRDPFFMMIRRSLNTFMNAMTSSDWTAYPFASQSKKDFDNLLEVYLDAVFFPRLDPLDFAQEGHRVEFEIPDDPDSNLVFKGVVYNEMKGAMSSPVAQLWQTSSSALFPTTTYHYNSGGEPANIPDLTYDQLKEFHARHYHPSNALFITYGNFPVEEHQQNIHDWALSRFYKKNLNFAVPDEQRFNEPQHITAPYAVDSQDSTEGKTHIVIHWLLDRITDLKGMMEMQLLAGVLLDNSASPLRLALEKTDLANGPSDLCGLDNSSHEATFICGVEGSDSDKADAVEELIFSVLNEVAEKGVSQDMIEAVLHQFELEQREITSGSYPYGLRLASAMLPIAMHRGDAIASLDIDPMLKQLREDINDPDFIKNLATQSLLNNQHRVRVVMTPDKELSARKSDQEKQRLAALRASMSEVDKQKIIKQTQDLEARQNTEDDPELLPKVGIEDVPTDIRIPTGNIESVRNTPATWYAQATNGLVYESVIVPLPDFSEQETALLNLYSDYLTELGAGDQNYLQMQARQSAVSGGVHASLSIRSTINDIQHMNAYLRIGVSGLTRKQADFSELLHTYFSSPRFDEYDRLKELIAQSRASREAAITGHGQSLAMAAAAAGISPPASLGHQWSGLQGIKQLTDLDNCFSDETRIQRFAEILAAIHEKILHSSNELLIVAEADNHETLATSLSHIWVSQAADEFNSFNPQFAAKNIRQAWLTNTQVNFCAKAFTTVPSSHPDAVTLTVLGRFLHNGYLHTAIREKGGAYGSGASYDSGTGAFRFFSYRDPRLAETLKDFDRSIEWLLENNHEFRQLEEAILGVISAIDRPNSPAGEAIQTHMLNLHGRNAKYRRAHRNAILEVTIDDLKRVAEIYLQPHMANVAVVSNGASRSALEKMDLEILTLQ